MKNNNIHLFLSLVPLRTRDNDLYLSTNSSSQPEKYCEEQDYWSIISQIMLGGATNIFIDQRFLVQKYKLIVLI